MSSLFVIRKRSNGRFAQTGYSDTDDIQAAVIYSGKGRYGYLLDADADYLEQFWGGVDVIRVRIEPIEGD